MVALQCNFHDMSSRASDLCSLQAQLLVLEPLLSVVVGVQGGGCFHTVGVGCSIYARCLLYYLPRDLYHTAFDKSTSGCGGSLLVQVCRLRCVSLPFAVSSPCCKVGGLHALLLVHLSLLHARAHTHTHNKTREMLVCLCQQGLLTVLAHLFVSRQHVVRSAPLHNKTCTTTKVHSTCQIRRLFP